MLVPQREVALLSRSGRHTLQVYIFHAFVSYAMAFLGVVPALYELMPSFTATTIVIALSVATTFVLDYPNSVQNGFNKLKQALDKQFSVEDAPQLSR